MTPGKADRNLLLGILAYQNAFITKEQLLVGMQAWLYDKAKPLGEILRSQGALDEPSRALLDALVDRHVQQHGGDPQRSLQAVSSAGSVRRDLEGLPDPDLQVSIGHLSVAKKDEDPYATTGVGTPTVPGVRFRILRPHAKGGLGEVFVAQDEELHREVALKEIQNRHADNQDSRARFMLEAEITGGLEHPGIVPVYGLGQYADGRPFYAMRFIRGDSLQDAIERFHKADSSARDLGVRAMELRKLLGRFIDVCQAMQYAHDRGILHRDLKPGNIMLGRYGETLVVDWGLAKAVGKSTECKLQLTDATEPILSPRSTSGSAETVAGSAVGTPAYMSPEQAAGRLDQLGPASDVYSLGATLYTLLTGKASVEDKDIGAVLSKVQRGDFPRPRQIRRDVHPALEAICLMAMALKPGDRYASPRVLADDIEHWLADEPVAAWPEPITVKVRRWVGHHKPLVTGVAALLLAALPLLTLLYVLSENARVDLAKEQKNTSDALNEQKKLADANKALAVKETKAREEADERREKAEELALQVQFNHLYEKSKGHSGLALVGTAQLLSKAAKLKNQRMLESMLLHVSGWAPDANRNHLSWIGTHHAPVARVALSADGRIAMTASEDSTAHLWDAVTGKRIGAPLQHPSRVNQVALSADGKIAVTACSDKAARLWETATGKMIGLPLAHDGPVAAVALSADGKIALTGTYENSARLWQTATGKPIGPPLQHQSSVNAVALSAEGAIALTGSSDKTARLWDGQTGKPKGPPLQHQGLIHAVALSPDGKIALTGSSDSTARLWDTAGANPIGPPLQHQDSVVDVALSADGAIALTGSSDRTARAWDAKRGTPIGPLLQHESKVASVALSADGKIGLTGTLDKTAHLWETATGLPIGPPLQHQRDVYSVALSADGKFALTGSIDKTARLWVTAAGKPVRSPLHHQDWVRQVALSADGQIALTGCWDKTARLWETATGKPIHPPLPHPDKVWSVALRADGKVALTGCADKTTRFWDTTNGTQIGAPMQHQIDAVAIALSADGKYFLTASGEKSPQLMELANGKAIGSPLQPQGRVIGVALSASGKIALTGTMDNTAWLWDTATGKPIAPPLQHQNTVFAVALSANGKIALTGSMDKTARLWESDTGSPIGAPLVHQDWVVAVALSADGKIALTGSNDETARLWETATGKPIGLPLQHQGPVQGTALSADGTIALTGSGDKTARIWRRPRLAKSSERIALWAQVITGIEADEHGNARVLDADEWQQRRLRLQELGGPLVVE